MFHEAGPRCLGSIPARAGEPAYVHGANALLWVYPRACGGATLCGMVILYVMGLSPRVRGSLIASGYYYDVAGSIPARAGEP